MQMILDQKVLLVTLDQMEVKWDKELKNKVIGWDILEKILISVEILQAKT
jgi:hypothetical protein